MDGDGTLDCPYNFDDKTGQNSGGSSSTKPSNTNQKDKSFDADEFIGNFLMVCLCVPLVLALIFNFFNEKMSKLLVSIAGISFFLSMLLYPILKVIAFFL